MRKLKGGKYKLNNGRIIHPYLSLAGMEQSRIEAFSLAEFDNGTFAYEVTEGHGNDPDLTKEEAKEVALYFSQLWLKFANSLKI